MTDILVIALIVLALAAGPEIVRRRGSATPVWVRRAWWRTNWFRPEETTRPRPYASNDEQAAAEIDKLCRVARGAPHH